MHEGQVAVITGAGSGIGRALAQALDSRGAELVLSDINDAGLNETAKLLRRKPTLQVVDVSKRAEVEALAAQVKDRFGRVDLVINNAGVTVHDTVVDASYEDFEWVMGINFWGVVYGTKSFLPMMLAQRSGVVVNISSIFGIVGWPLQGLYNASKFAVRGFTEVLWRELEGTGVRAMTVHPGGIKTNIVSSMRFRRGQGAEASRESTLRLFDKMARTTPEQCAEVILNGVESKARRVLVGQDAVMLDRLQRTLPSDYPAALGLFEKRAAARRKKRQGR